MIRLIAALAVTMTVTGCGTGADEEVKKAQVDLSAEARTDAVIEAATRHFNQSVKEPFLVQQGMTVRGLARAATKSPKAELHASRYDSSASTSAKLELINGKIVYTAVAAESADSAAVIVDGETRWRIAYEVEAQLTPEGELKAFVLHQLGEAHRAN